MFYTLYKDLVYEGNLFFKDLLRVSLYDPVVDDGNADPISDVRCDVMLVLRLWEITILA